MTLIDGVSPSPKRRGRAGSEPSESATVRRGTMQESTKLPRRFWRGYTGKMCKTKL